MAIAAEVEVTGVDRRDRERILPALIEEGDGVDSL
jgi:hypothetical protein